MYGVPTPGAVVALDSAITDMLRSFDYLEGGVEAQQGFAVNALMVRAAGAGSPEQVYVQIRDIFNVYAGGISLAEEFQGTVAGASVRKFIGTTATATEGFYVPWVDYPEFSRY